jgi:8-oxo-dGTP diphosphatase
VVGAAILRDGRCLVAQRAAHVSNPHRWEFPGGKVEPHESPTAALRREIAEELALDIDVGTFLGRGEAKAANGRHIVLDVYRAQVHGDATLRLTDHQAARWIDATEIHTLDWATADIPVLPALADALR